MDGWMKKIIQDLEIGNWTPSSWTSGQIVEINGIEYKLVDRASKKIRKYFGITPYLHSILSGRYK